MRQLPLPLLIKRPDPVDAVLAVAQRLGWEPDPARITQRRWYLPGTVYKLRVDFHSTQLYCVCDSMVYNLRRFATANLPALTVALEDVRLEVAALQRKGT